MTSNMAAALPTPASGDDLQRIADATPGDQKLYGVLWRDDDWRPVAFYPARGGAGVTVCVHRMPADFYRVSCPQAETQLGTCSGELGARLAHAVATHLANGGSVAAIRKLWAAHFTTDELGFD